MSRPEKVTMPARRRAGDPEGTDFTPSRGTRAVMSYQEELEAYADHVKDAILGAIPRSDKKISLQAWFTGVGAAALITLLAFFAGRDRKSIDDNFAESRRDRAELHMVVTSHDTQIQLMKQQLELIQAGHEKLAAQAEEQNRKLTEILRAVK